MYVDWTLSQEPFPSLVNVVHPQPASWEELLKGITAELGNELPMVAFDEWLSQLKSRANNATVQDLMNLVRSEQSRD